MNISTYEARIKALEDQLNPPGPGGSTGLLSVTVSPDITLADGTSLNAKIAAEMPIEGTSEGRPPMKIITGRPETPFEEGAEYSLVITPASGDMAGYGMDTLSSEEGAPLSGSVHVSGGTFEVGAFSFNGFQEVEGERLPNKTAKVGITIGSIS